MGPPVEAFVPGSVDAVRRQVAPLAACEMGGHGPGDRLTSPLLDVQELAGRVDPDRIAFKLDGCIEIEKQYAKIKYDKKQYGEQKVTILAKA